MTTTEPRVPRGTRDLLPSAARRRQYVIDTLRDVFETFGFEPLVTPSFELAETLLGKYGPDAERLIYRAGLGDEMDLALRYDHSVPLARVSAAYEELPRPFKRYAIGPVWRGERPQRGRYREFTQADVDIVGSDSMLADAEIMTVVDTGLRRLGFEQAVTKINNRKLLNGIGRYAGVPEALLPGLYRAIDKLDKVGLEGVRLELRSVGLPGDLINRQRQAVGRWLRGKADRATLAENLIDAVDREMPRAVVTAAIPAFLDALEAYPNGGAGGQLDEAREAVMAVGIKALRDQYPDDALIPDAVTARTLELLRLEGESRALIDALDELLDDPEATAGLDELRQVLDALEAGGVPADGIAVDFAMVRGLAYYTGTIFETVVTKPAIGSLLGGGRFDELVSLFGRDVPAVGTSFGVDRLVDVMDEVGLFPDDVDRPAAQVLVARFDQPTTAAAVGLTSELRAAGVPAALYLELDPLGDQIRYALKQEIPVVAIIGPEEAETDRVALRDLDSREQQTVPRAEAADAVRALLPARVLRTIRRADGGSGATA